MTDFKVGEYIIYQNGDRYEIGRIKHIADDGAFVWYHEGATAAKTPFDCMHKLVNEFTIEKTTLGGNRPLAFMRVRDENPKFYFTFGSNPQFPFTEYEYVVIQAENEAAAHKIFRSVWPPRPGSNCTNCAFTYSEEEWNDIYLKYYAGIAPSAFIRQGKHHEQAS